MKSKIKVIPVCYVPPPREVVEAVKNADKPKLTIIYPREPKDD